MTTDLGGVTKTVERNNRRTRWFHAGVYLTVLVLLFTGWWLTLGREGDASPLPELFGTSDTDLHNVIGWVFVGLTALGLLLGWRAAWTLGGGLGALQTVGAALVRTLAGSARHETVRPPRGSL